MNLALQKGEQIMSTSEVSELMCRSSLKAGGIRKGFRQVTKSIMTGNAKLVMISQEINDKKMAAVINGLTNKYGLPVLQIKDHKELARYVGICKTDETGKIVKEAKCAVASIEDFGEDIESKEMLFERIGLAE